MRQPQRAPDLRRRRRPLRVRLLTTACLAVFSSWSFSSQCKLKRPLPPPPPPCCCCCCWAWARPQQTKSPWTSPRPAGDALSDCPIARLLVCNVCHCCRRLAQRSRRLALPACSQQSASPNVTTCSRPRRWRKRQKGWVAPRSRRQTPAEGFASPTLVAPMPEPADPCPALCRAHPPPWAACLQPALLDQDTASSATRP